MISAATCFLALLLVPPSPDAFDPGPDPLLAQHPTVNATAIVFAYAGDLWRVPRHGGEAVRLTATPGGTAANPYFSPDGKSIAFSANYEGNTDVYVVSSEGGNPKRLTAYPGRNDVEGWTRDGQSVLFRSAMLSNTDYGRLFTVSINGGFPKPLPFPAGEQGSFSPDGTKLAYVPNPKWEQAWKRYRGGQTTPVWIGDLSDSHIVPVPRKNTNDSYPMWIGNSIYYLSDPTGPVGLSRFDLNTGHGSVVVPGRGFDLKSATAGPGVIAYEKLGSIHVLDLQNFRDERIAITLHGDFPSDRYTWKDVRPHLTSISPSPSGRRFVACARGWLFSVPLKKGDTRLLDDEQGCDRNSAVWSPDGKSIAYTQDDRKGERLIVLDAETGVKKQLSLGDPPGNYGELAWSPDSKRIAYTDNKLNLWAVDVATGTNTKIDTGSYRATANMAAVWSPDSQWLAYARDLPNFLKSIALYSFRTKTSTLVTDELANATDPAFDRGGKYLYFLASTDIGFGIDTEDIMALGVTNTSQQVYGILLKKETTSPLSPESDEESVAPETKGPKTVFDIDLDGIQKRAFSVPLPRADYRSIIPGPEDSFFTLSSNPRLTAVDRTEPGQLIKFSFKDRKTTVFSSSVASAQATSDGSKLLIHSGGEWTLIAADAPPGPTPDRVDLSQLKVKIDPAREWEAIYHQVWRQERILFYDPGLHGIDANAMERRYEPFLANLHSRADLNYLFTDMLGELCIGHMFIGGGDLPEAPRVQGGLLGADYSFQNGRYRLTRVYDGESWNPGLHAPLGDAGVRAKPGEYVLSIDGKELTQATDIYVALEGTAGKRVSVRLGPNADGTGSRTVAVTPVASESELRNAAWREDNRRYVDQATGGHCGYVAVPDTGSGGWTAFMRYYYTQNDKDAIIVDERFNHGGAINDFMVREMEKPLDYYGATRYGLLYRTPNAAVYGPKVMLANEMAGSGGDIFPYLFKQHHTGKLVGHTTWGGELSAYGFPVIDGGTIRAPDDANFDIKTGEYCIDNVGVSPDIAVEFDPKLWSKGIDSQLQAAVEEIKKEMIAHPPTKFKRPKYPDKSKLPQP
jgi:tricorn protease